MSCIIKRRQSHPVVHSSPEADTENLVLTWRCHIQLTKCNKPCKSGWDSGLGRDYIPYDVELDSAQEVKIYLHPHPHLQTPQPHPPACFLPTPCCPLNCLAWILAHTQDTRTSDTCLLVHPEGTFSLTISPPTNREEPLPAPSSPRLQVVSQSAYKPRGASDMFVCFRENKQRKIHKRAQLYCSFSSETASTCKRRGKRTRRFTKSPPLPWQVITPLTSHRPSN